MLKQVKGQDMHVNDLMAAGTILREQGHYHAAAVLFETALETTTKETPAHKEENVATISGWPASVYKSQGHWSKAEKLELGALEQLKRILGVEHPKSIGAAANLAVTYWNQGRQGEAEKVGLEVLAQRRRISGKEHLDTI
jgi:hypothetical protein